MLRLLAVRAREDHGRGEVDADADEGDGEHEPAAYVGRRHQAPHRLEQDQPPRTSSETPFAWALRISARLSPYVIGPSAGRAASRMAKIESPSAAASVSMCAASESSASEFGDEADDDLAAA